MTCSNCIEATFWGAGQNRSRHPAGRRSLSLTGSSVTSPGHYTSTDKMLRSGDQDGGEAPPRPGGDGLVEIDARGVPETLEADNPVTTPRPSAFPA